MHFILRQSSSLRTLFSRNLRCLSYSSNEQNTQRSFHKSENSQSCNVNYTSCLLFAASTGLGFGLGYYLTFEDCHTPKILPAVEAASVIGGHGNLRTKYNFIADIVSTVTPSVVYIEIRDQTRIDLFTGKPATVSNGSGFVVQEDGLILTNAHVVINKPHSNVLVRLHDGSVYNGRVEDVDMKSDLATVRIDRKNLPVMKLGNSRDLRPGEWVVAVGSPLSLSNTITVGVVSSVNRGSEELGLRGKDMDYIQTDASITFGNSGGPLVNLNGEAIGINSMKVTPGISFAIPIDYAKDFLKRSQDRRSSGFKDVSTRKFLGITMLTLTPDIIAELQMRDSQIPPDVAHGIIVWKVVVGSPAYRAGLKPGDIVTHINGKPVESARTIYKALEESNEMTLVIFRRGVRFTVYVKPEESL